MELKRYGSDALFVFPIIGAGVNDFLTGATIAAGDAKVWTDTQILTNLAVESVAFTSGSERPTNGATLEGATSSETCVFMFAVVTSGTWSGGDAAGWLFVKTVSGVFSAENLDIQGGTANVLTIGGDFTAGLFREVGGGDYALALTGAETLCRLGTIKIIDASGDLWEDTEIRFETYGNPNSQHAFDLNKALQDVNVTQILGTAASLGTFTLAAVGSGVITLPDEDDDEVAIPDGDQFEYHELFVSSGGGSNQVIKLTTATANPREYNVVAVPTGVNTTSVCYDNGPWVDPAVTADAVLTRNVSNVEASADEHTLCTVVLAMLEHSISDTTLTIKRTDGSTTHYSKTLTTDAAAEPITGIN